jgi:hypothetical protein
MSIEKVTAKAVGVGVRQDRFAFSADTPSIFFVGIVVGELFAGRTHVHVLRRHVDASKNY